VTDLKVYDNRTRPSITAQQKRVLELEKSYGSSLSVVWEIQDILCFADESWETSNTKVLFDKTPSSFFV